MGHQEIGAFDCDDVARRIESRAGHDAVQVRMKQQPLVPSAEDGCVPWVLAPSQRGLATLLFKASFAAVKNKPLPHANPVSCQLFSIN